MLVVGVVEVECVFEIEGVPVDRAEVGEPFVWRAVEDSELGYLRRSWEENVGVH